VAQIPNEQPKYCRVSCRTEPRLSWCFSAFILMLALGARLWNIRHQSVWLDEFFSYNYLDAPSLYECIVRQRPENWEMVPLYYAVQYCWAQIIPESAVWVRLLSVVPSALAAAAAALATWKYLGRLAGVMTGFWLALSPFHVFYGQGIRPYAWLPLMGLISWLFLLWWRQTGRRRWLALSLLVNFAMLWTHLLTALILVAQGLWLWGNSRFRISRAVIAWGLLHGLACLTLIPWIMTIRPAPDPAGMAAPPLGPVIGILLDGGTDASESFLGRLLFQDNEPVRWAWGIPPKFPLNLAGSTLGLLAAIRQPVELALARLMLLGIFLSVLAWLFKRPAQPSDTTPQQPGRADPIGVWMAGVLFPALALYLLSLAWKPHVFQVRYLFFAWVFLPGALVSGFCRMAPRTARLYAVSAASLLIVLFFGYGQLPVRQDYRSIINLLRSPEYHTVRALTPDWNLARVLVCNDRTLKTGIDWLEPDRFAYAVADEVKKGAPFMLVFEGGLSDELRRQIEYDLIQWEVAARRKIFGGMQNLYLYVIDPRETSSPSL